MDKVWAYVGAYQSIDLQTTNLNSNTKLEIQNHKVYFIKMNTMWIPLYDEKNFISLLN